jgi:hypothetical protein
MSHPVFTSDPAKPGVWPSDPAQLPGGFVVSGWEPLQGMPGAGGAAGGDPNQNPDVPLSRRRWRGCRCWVKNADPRNITAVAYAVAYCH